MLLIPYHSFPVGNVFPTLLDSNSQKLDLASFAVAGKHIMFSTLKIHDGDHLRPGHAACVIVAKQVLLSCLILLCGVNLKNPGPSYRFPCGNCNKPCRSNQKAIFCDGCSFWFHAKCQKLSDDHYFQLGLSTDKLIPLPRSSLSPHTGSPSSESFASLENSRSSKSYSFSGPFNVYSLNNSKLCCILLNACSLKSVTASSNKLIQFQQLIYSSLPSLVVVTETWLKDNIDDSEILPRGYNIFRLDRPGDRKGGGLASREDLSCSIKPELRSGGEIMVCELKIAVIAAYRPPDDSSSFIPFLFSTLTKVESSGYSHLLLLRDFNFPQIDWQLTSSSQELENQFCNLLDDFSLIQLIEDPTHIHGNILDLVATNFPESFTKPVCSNSVVNSISRVQGSIIFLVFATITTKLTLITLELIYQMPILGKFWIWMI